MPSNGSILDLHYVTAAGPTAPPPATVGPDIRWTLRAELDSVDITSELEGVASVEAEEGSARMAELTLNPSGVVIPSDYVGQTVDLWVQKLLPTGAVDEEHQIFSGIVDEPIIEPYEGTLTLRCSDNLQRRLEESTRTAIDAVLPGSYWDPALFRRDADSYQYAQDRVSTLPGDIELNLSGVVVYTPWDAQAIADKVYDENTVLEGTVDVAIGTARDLVNELRLTCIVRSTRHWQREIDIEWIYNRTFNDYLVQSSTLPNKQMALDALERTQWATAEVAFTELPPSGVYNVPGVGDVAFLKTTTEIVTEIDAKSVKRWIQDLEEQFIFTLAVPPSQTNFGTLPAQNQLGSDLRVGIGNDNNDTWEDFTLTPRIDQQSTVDPVPPIIGGTDIGEGNSYIDRVDPADRDNFIQTALNKSAVQLYASHRHNTVSFTVPCQPLVDRPDTIEFQGTHVQCKGKVRRYAHRFSMNTGEAITEIDLAIARGGGGASDPLLTPAPPPVPSLVSSPVPNNNQTFLGGEDTSPPEPPDDQIGYIGNLVDEGAVSPVIYTVRLTFGTPEVPPEYRETLPSWILITNNYSAATNEDLLCNSSGGSFNIQLPNSPVDGATIRVAEDPTTNSFPTNPVQILPGTTPAGTTVNGGASYFLNTPAETAELVYDDGTNDWTVTPFTAILPTPITYNVGIPDDPLTLTFP